MKTAWAWASVAEELLAFVEKVQEESAGLTKKEKEYEEKSKEGGE